MAATSTKTAPTTEMPFSALPEIRLPVMAFWAAPA